MTTSIKKGRVQHRGKTTHSARVVERLGNELSALEVRLPEATNRFEYFDDLQRAVAGLTALLESELSPDEILAEAAKQAEEMEPETYAVITELLGEDVTDKMRQINRGLDELADLVSSIEESLAAFSPLNEEYPVLN